MLEPKNWLRTLVQHKENIFVMLKTSYLIHLTKKKSLQVPRFNVALHETVYTLQQDPFFHPSVNRNLGLTLNLD